MPPLVWPDLVDAIGDAAVGYGWAVVVGLVALMVALRWGARRGY